MGIGDPGITLEFSEDLNVMYGDNGSGKSSIWNAVLVALGGTSRRSNDLLLRNGTDFGFSEVILNNNSNGKDLIEHHLTTGMKTIAFKVEFKRFIDNNQKERIVRSYKVNGKTKSQATIQEILKKIEFEADDQATFIASGQTKSILDSSPVSLLKHFERILKLQNIRKDWDKDLIRLEEINVETTKINTELLEKNAKLNLLRGHQERFEKKQDIEEKLNLAILNQKKSELNLAIKDQGKLEDEQYKLSEHMKGLRKKRKGFKENVTNQSDVIEILNGKYNSIKERLESKSNKINKFSIHLGKILEQFDKLNESHILANEIPHNMDIPDVKLLIKSHEEEIKRIDIKLNSIAKDIKNNKQIKSDLENGKPLTESSIAFQKKLAHLEILTEPFYKIISFNDNTPREMRLLIEGILKDLRYSLVTGNKVSNNIEDVKRVFKHTNFENYLISLPERDKSFSSSYNDYFKSFYNCKYKDLSEIINEELIKAIKNEKYSNEIINNDGIIQDGVGYRNIFTDKIKPVIDWERQVKTLEVEIKELEEQLEAKKNIKNEKFAVIDSFNEFRILLVKWDSKAQLLKEIDEKIIEKETLEKTIAEHTIEQIRIQGELEAIGVRLKEKEGKKERIKERIQNINAIISEKEDQSSRNEAGLKIIKRTRKKLELEFPEVNLSELHILESPSYYDAEYKILKDNFEKIKDAKDYSQEIKLLEFEIEEFKGKLDQCRDEVSRWEDKILSYIKRYRLDLQNCIKKLNHRFNELMSLIEANGKISLIGKADTTTDNLGIDLKVRFFEGSEYHSALGESIFSSGEKAAILIAFIVSVQETFLKHTFCFWDEIYERTDPIRTEELMKILGASRITYLIISPQNIYLKPAKTVYLVRKREKGNPSFVKIPEAIFKADITSTKIPYYLEKRDDK